MSNKQIAESALDYLLLEIGRETSRSTLDQIGYRIGYSLIEKYSSFTRLTQHRSRFVDTLDIIKFICKEFWIYCFRKQVDNLKTNHRVFNIDKGVYVLTDNSFTWISKMSSDSIHGEEAQLIYNQVF